MNEKAVEALGKSFGDVMENMAFMFPETETTESFPENFLRISMEFKGPFSGSLQIISDMDVCEELAANVLGVDDSEDISLAMVEDALKETLNTICGRFLSEFAGEKPVFNLSTPKLIDGFSAETEQIDNSVTRFFSIDDRAVVLIFSLD